MPMRARCRASSRPDSRDPPAAVAAVAERLAVEADLAGIEFLEQVDAAEKRRLARAAGADDRHHVGRQDVEVDAAQDRVRAEALGQAPDGEDRRPRVAPSAAGSGARATSRRCR